MSSKDDRPDAKHIALCKELAAKLIEPLREIAKQHGYALGVHGSLARDIDLIAVPWVDGCCEPRTLAEAIRAEAARLNHGIAFDIDSRGAANPDYFHNGTPGSKPHGRLVWCWHLGGGPYIDLSVMPPDHGARDRIHAAMMKTKEVGDG